MVWVIQGLGLPRVVPSTAKHRSPARAFRSMLNRNQMRADAAPCSSPLPGFNAGFKEYGGEPETLNPKLGYRLSSQGSGFQSHLSASGSFLRGEICRYVPGFHATSASERKDLLWLLAFFFVGCHSATTSTSLLLLGSNVRLPPRGVCRCFLEVFLVKSLKT